MQDKRNFDWSLKPILWSMKILAGAPIGIVRAKSKRSLAASFIIILLGFAIHISNICINGPRVLNPNRFFWMKEIQNFDSPFSFFRDFPDALLQFVIDITTVVFFFTIPVIHLFFFFTTLLSRKWIDLASALKKIQNEMKLSKEFHRKCRKLCFIALYLLFLVGFL